MSIINLKDRGGQNMKLLEVCGVRIFPSFPPNVLPEIPKLKLRDDDILIAAYMRSVDWGTWFDHVRDWENVFETNPNLDVHLCYYEEMIKNPMEELRNVKEFIGTNTTETLLKDIVEKCRLDRMREDKYNYEWLEDGVCIHYMKGKVGAWKDRFTVQQYEVLEMMYREKMAGSKFEDRYKGRIEFL